MRIPKYREHSSGQARVTLSGRTFYLGRYGSAESRREYKRLVGEFIASDGVLITESDKADLSVAEMLLAFITWADDHYGTSTELDDLRLIIRRIQGLYAEQRAVEFGFVQFETIRQGMVKDGMTRLYINEQMRRLVRIFKWAASRNLIRTEVAGSLSMIDPLRKGRTTARESKPILPVPSETLEATLEFLPQVVADMVRLQRLVGCRPGEVCQIKPSMIDRSGDVWQVHLEKHKNQYRGKQRTLYVGPKGQKILVRYLDRDPDQYCFSPAESEKQRLKARRAARVTPDGPGRSRPGLNRTRNRKRPPGDHYDKDSYRKAIHRACAKAFPAPEELGPKAEKSWHADHRWNPNQIRHSAGTQFRQEADLETARVMLGHSNVSTTEIYAEQDRNRAIEYARRAG